MTEQTTAIGEVEEAEGQVTALRDGQQINLQVGDPVYLEDEIISEAGEAIGLRLVDGTQFSIAENSRMVLDEFVYDPNAGQGAVAISVLSGAFSFVSGQASAFGPDAMTVNTPVGTMGIRGTKVIGRIDLETGTLSIVLVPESDGTIGQIAFMNEAGEVILSQPFEALSNVTLTQLPTVIQLQSLAAAQAFIGTVYDVLDPLSVFTGLPGLDTPPRDSDHNLDDSPADADGDDQGFNLAPTDGEIEDINLASTSEEDLLEETGSSSEEDTDTTAENDPSLEGDFTLEDLLNAQIPIDPEVPEIVLTPVEQILSGPQGPVLDPDEDDDLLTPILTTGNTDLGTPNGIVPSNVSTFQVTPGQPTTVPSGTNLSQLTGSDTSDTVTIEAGSTVTNLSAGGGDDIININGTVSVADLGTGNDTLTIFNTGSVSNVYGGAGNDQITSQPGGGEIDGGNGNDILTGGTASGVLIGGDGNDIVYAGDAGDVIVGGSGRGDDTYYGGAGEDTVRYTSAETAGITVNLITGLASGIDIDTDTLFDIEHIIGGQLGDTLTGSNATNSLDGYWGDDTLSGLDGDDVLYGGIGNVPLVEAVKQQGYGIITYTDVDGKSRVDGMGKLTQEDGSRLDIMRIRNASDTSEELTLKISGATTTYTIEVPANADYIFQTDFNGGTYILYDAQGEKLKTAGNKETEFTNDTPVTMDFNGNDTLFGGSGNDTLVDMQGTNAFYGGTGIDTWLLTGNTTINLEHDLQAFSSLEIIAFGDSDATLQTDGSTWNADESGGPLIISGEVGTLDLSMVAEAYQSGTNLSAEAVVEASEQDDIPENAISGTYNSWSVGDITIYVDTDITVNS